MGLTVYRTAKLNTRVHRSPECWRLKVNATSPVYELDLASVSAPNLCRTCFPDAPRIRVWHAICRTCGQSRPYPCAHNGAVQVLVSQRDGVSSRQPGQAQGTLVQTRWVWPENAHHYTLVDTPVSLVNSGHTL